MISVLCVKISGILLIQIMLLNLSGCMVKDAACGTEIIKEIKSPDEKRKAVIYRRSCGVTTNNSTHISVIPADQNLPNEGGNIFIAEIERKFNTDDYNFIDLTVEWGNERQLFISFDKECCLIFNYQQDFGDIDVLYKFTDQ